MNIPTINLGSIQIPINAATKTFAMLAKRGAGKTYTVGVMAEEFSRNHLPFVVFDPIDVWWGLRLSADGKGKGLPIVVFGLEHADIPLTRDMGRQIAQAIVKENISCVISTFGMPKVGMRYLIAEFADELLNINNTPRHVFIEEAHEFVPLRVMGTMAKTFSAVEALVVMERNRVIGVTLINQRAATINTDVLTQLDTLLAFRNVSPQDRKALKDWVEYHSAEGDFEKFMASLPSLPTGEGWIWSPEFLGIFERIHIRKRETFHPDREKIGDKFVMPQLDQVGVALILLILVLIVRPSGLFGAVAMKKL
jgi:DNA helicase HerA-like ATPase